MLGSCGERQVIDGIEHQFMGMRSGQAVLTATGGARLCPAHPSNFPLCEQSSTG